MIAPRLLIVGFLWFATLTLTLAAAAAASSDASVFGVSTKKKTSKLPEWLTIHKDREKMSHYLELARQRHTESILEARDAYFSGSPATATATITITTDDDDSNDDSSSSNNLKMEEYEIKASGDIPDFVDELEQRIFVTGPSTPLFTKEECQDMISNAEEHFETKAGGEWTTLPSGQYDVAGFWIKNIPACHDWFNRMVQTRLFPLLVKQFPEFCLGQMEDLCVDNAYVFKYTPETGRRTDVHTDSGCLSFTISLNGNDEYSGGGTWFEGLQKTGGDNSNNNSAGNVIEMNVGQCTVRPGGVRHCGHAVTSGTRYIIGGFCMNSKKVEYVRMLIGLGNEEKAKQNLKTAREALEVAIALNPNYDGPYSHLADLYTKLGETAKAQEVLEHCFLHVNPQSGEVAYSLGVIYLNTAKYAEAMNCMKACLEADDADVDAMLVMAQACAGQEDNLGEKDWYERLVSTPGAAPDVAGKAYCNLGVLHEGTELEIEYYEKSLECLPDSFPNRYSLACAYASNQRWDSAIPTFRKAIDVAEENSDLQLQAIQNLYKAIMNKLQQDNSSDVTSREQMMKRFIELMGEDNYQKMAAARQ